MDSTMSPRRHRKQPDWYGKLTPSKAISSDCELDNEDTDPAEYESETSKDSDVLDQGPWADSSDDEQTHERTGPRSKRRSTAPAAAVQPSKKAKVAQPEARRTASSRQGKSRKGGGCASRVLTLPDGGRAVETETATSSAHQFVYLPSAFGSECFPNPPYDVPLRITVDGRLADLGAASGQVRQHTLGNGRTQHYLFHKTGLWDSYPGHVITKLSTNSSSSELTCHLRSPAGQQAGAVAEAAAIAAEAAAGQTYWFEHQGTGRTLVSGGQVYFPKPLLQKVFGLALPSSAASVEVVLAVHMNDQLASRANQPMIIHKKSWRIRVPLEVRQQLAGFKLVRFRAAKPNLLEVYFSSGDTQEPAAVPVAPVPPSASPSQPAAAQSNIQQAGTPAAGFAAGRMPSATAALTEQQTSSTPTPRASTASAIAAARAGSSAGLFGLRDGGLAAGRSGAAAASSAENTADAAAATAVAHSTKSSRRSIQLAAAGAMPKVAAAAGVPDTRSSARAVGAEGAAAATSRPGTPGITTPAQQTRKQVQKHVTFDLPAANHGTVEAGSGFRSHDRPELNTSIAVVAAAGAAAANTAASKSPVVTACLQTPPQSAPKGRAEFYSTAACRASWDLVQGYAATGRRSTNHRLKSVLQERQQLAMQQLIGTPAAAGLIDLTISSDEETDNLPVYRALDSAVPDSVSQRRNKQNRMYTKPSIGVTHRCSIQQLQPPWKQSAAVAAGTTPAAKTVSAAAPSSGLGAATALKTVEAAATGAGAAIPRTPLAAAATTPAAPAAPATLGLKLEAHTAHTAHTVHNPTRSMAVQTATVANDRTRAAGLPAGFILEPFRSVPLAFQQLVLLLEVLAAPDELMQQLQTAAQAMIDAEGAADWSRKLEVLEMQYSIMQAYVRRGRADLAEHSVHLLLNRAVVLSTAVK